MFWKFVERLVLTTYLLLGLVMGIVLYGGVNQNAKAFDFEGSLQLFKEDITKAISSNLEYTENRVNRLSRNVDEYQSSMSTRQDILEGKVKALEQENKNLKNQSKVINNNLLNNSVTVQK